MMRKTLCFLLALLLILPLVVACNITNVPDSDTGTGTESESASESSFESTSESTSESATESETETETEAEPEIIPTAEILDKIIYLFVDDTYELNYRISETNGKADGDANRVLWSSSDERCVTVSNGTLQAHQQGYAVVSGGGDTSCTVRVISKTMPIVSDRKSVV